MNETMIAEGRYGDVPLFISTVSLLHSAFAFGGDLGI